MKAGSGGLVPADSSRCNDAVSVGMQEQVVKLLPTEMQVAAVVGALQVGVPDGKCGALEFLPGEPAEPIGAWKGLNVTAGDVHGIDAVGEDNWGH